MNHPHLLEEEIDRLLDDDAQDLDRTPLEAHLDECAACRARLAEERRVVDLLVDAPRYAPSHQFADRVMSQVAVTAPWHTGVREVLRQWAPASRRARIVGFALAVSAGSVLTIAIAWAAMRPDMVVFAAEIAESRIREILLRAGHDLVVSLLGDRAGVVASRAGATSVMAMGLLLAATAIATLAGLRAIATAVGRRRE